jgi:heat shock protein HspQ
MAEESAAFAVGQIVRHLRFGYRGVVVDVDPVFSLSDAWYEEVARSRPPKDRPWYHVLVDETPIRHPLLARYFDDFRDGRYRRQGAIH